MRLNFTSAFSTIKLGEGNSVPNRVQVLRVGSFNHPDYGKFEVTKQVLSEMKNNFDSRIRGIDVSFDYYHESNEDASAWVNKLVLNDTQDELWAEVEWTPKAERKLADRELRYFSPDFAFKWKDPESGKTFNNVLFGGGLTNRPFVKNMAAIVADEKTKGFKMNELEKAQEALKLSEAKVLKLTEEKGAMEQKMLAMPQPSEVENLKKQIADLQAKLDAALASEKVALEEKQKADEAKKLAEKETAFNLLLSEGKAVVAQKDAYMKNDMTEFIKLAQPLNMNGRGSSQGHNDSTPESEKADKIIKLAEEKQKANPKLSRVEAIKLAKEEIK